jgi:hypothetical protein
MEPIQVWRWQYTETEGAKLRKADRKILAHVRRGRQAIQRRRVDAVDAGDPEVGSMSDFNPWRSTSGKDTFGISAG